MQENAIYSVISPEGCAAILWRDAGEAKKAAAAFKPDARHCLELGCYRRDRPRARRRCAHDHDEAARCSADSLRGAGRGRRSIRRTGDAYDGRAGFARWASSSSSGRRPSTASTGLSPVRGLSLPEAGTAAGLVPTPDRHESSFSLRLTRLRGTKPRSEPTRRIVAVARLREYERKRSKEQDPGALRRQAAEGARADLRRPAARRAPAPLRLPPRARRRAGELGRAEGHPARARPAPPRRARRGPSARLRDVRGRDPGRASTAPARLRSGTTAPTSCSRRSATAA